MKKLLALLTTILCFQLSLSAQFDNMFYYPQKEWKAEVNLPPYEDIYLYSEQDTLHSVLIKPEGKPIATIFYIHGNSGNISVYDIIFSTFVDAGFQVFATDFRGYGKSSGKPTHLNMAKDGQLVFDYVVNHPDIQNTKLVVYGASIGTQLAAKLVQDNEEKVDLLVLEDGMSSFTDIALTIAPDEAKAQLELMLVSPYSSKTAVAEIKNVPKLIIHGTQDKVVPFAQGELVFQNASEPKKFITTEFGHLETLQKEPELILNEVKKLLE